MIPSPISTPDCWLVPSHPQENVMVDKSCIECTTFYYHIGNVRPKLPRSSSCDLNRQLLQQDQRRRRRRRRSSYLFRSQSPSFSVELPSTSSEASSPVLSNDNYPIQLLHRSPQTWPCLDVSTAEQLRSYLPVRIAVSCRWILLYSLDQHGCSLHTLYERTSRYTGPCLLVVQTTGDELFGAYISESLQVRNLYYGSGECFLWKVDGKMKPHDQPRVHHWTEVNDYIVHSDYDYISIGGGDGRVGLWIHHDLMHGHTETCPTFDNEPLAAQPDFECLGIEIWGFDF